MFCKFRYSWKFRKFHRKTPVSESLFNKLAGLKSCNFVKKRFQHKCYFPVKFAKFLKTPFLRKTSGGCFRKLLLRRNFSWDHSNRVSWTLVMDVSSPKFCLKFNFYYPWNNQKGIGFQIFSDNFWDNGCNWLLNWKY